MPRKQRFKPSRKPKPNPQNEDAMMRQVNSTTSREDADAMREAPQVADQAPARDPESDIAPG